MSALNEKRVENSEPRGKYDLLKDLDEALDTTLDTYHEYEDVPQDFRDLRLILGNQITIMETLKFLLANGWSGEMK